MSTTTGSSTAVPGSGDDSLSVLATVRDHQAAAERAQLGMLISVVEFAEFNSPASAPTWGLRGGDAALGEMSARVAGDGAPGVAEFAICDLAAALGWSDDAARELLAHGIELAHRLPRVWSRTRAGRMPVRRARQIAAATLSLSAEAAAFVDARLAPFAGKAGPTMLQRLCDEARDRYAPDEAEARRAEAAETRHVRIDLPDHLLHGGIHGLGYVDAAVDAADAFELETAVRHLAADRAAWGSTESLDVRRSRALGQLARTQLAFDLSADTVDVNRDGRTDTRTSTDRPKPRQVVFHVHLSDASLVGGMVDCPELKTHLTVEQVFGWLSDVGIDRTDVTVRPVVDLTAESTSAGYQPSTTLRDQIILGEPTCAFPHCTRASVKADLDHVIPYAAGGPTSDTNLAPLCRRHHRAKTVGRWSYTKIDPGHYLWRNHLGYVLEKTPDGTTLLHAPDPRGSPGGPDGT